MQVNSANTPSYFVGLTPAERTLIVLQAAAEQDILIREALDSTFSQSRKDVENAVAPIQNLADNLAQQNKANQVTALNFWDQQEKKRQAGQLGVGLQPLAIKGNPLAPKKLGGQGPLEFANKNKVTGTPTLATPLGTPLAPQVGLPKVQPIKTFDLQKVLAPELEANEKLIGQLLDVIA